MERYFISSSAAAVLLARLCPFLSSFAALLISQGAPLFILALISSLPVVVYLSHCRSVAFSVSSLLVLVYLCHCRSVAFSVSLWVFVSLRFAVPILSVCLCLFQSTFICLFSSTRLP